MGGPFLAWSLTSVYLFHLRNWVEEAYFSRSMKRGTIKGIIRTLPEEVRNYFILEASTIAPISHSRTRKSPTTLSKPTISERACKEDLRVMWRLAVLKDSLLVAVSWILLSSLLQQRTAGAGGSWQSSSRPSFTDDTGMDDVHTYVHRYK